MQKIMMIRCIVLIYIIGVFIIEKMKIKKCSKIIFIRAFFYY